jgi:cytochrome c553
MRAAILFMALSTITSVSVAGMMGGGMGGMMGQQASPATPPPQDANAEVRKGYHLVQSYCIQCHQAPNPNQHSAADWPAVVTRMQGYMQRQQQHSLSKDQRRLIIDYLGNSGS